MVFRKRLNHKTFYILGISLLVFFYFGYEIGTSDSVEFMPYVQYLVNPSLFQKDVFLQSLATRPWNERYVFAQMVAWSTQGNEYLVLIFQFLVLVSTIWALWVLGEFFKLKPVFNSAMLLAILIALEGWNLSCSEFYVGIFEASNITLSIQCWALVFLVQKRWPWIFGLSFLATLIQPQMGSNFLLVCSILYIGEVYFFRNSFSWLSILFLILGFGYVGFLYVNIKENGLVITDLAYEKIVYVFRLPHHIYFTSFSKKGIVLNIVLWLVALFYFMKAKNPLIVSFLVLILLGSLVYGLSLQLHLPLGIHTWWMRMSIWVRLMGVLSLFKIIQENELIQKNLKPAIVLLWLGICLVLILRNRFNSYRMDSLISPQTPEIQVCRWVERNTPRSAVLVHPFGFTGMNYYGKRSCYVNFKAIPKPKSYVKVWFDRLQLVYGLDTLGQNMGFAMAPEADQFLYEKIKNDITFLKNEGVTHIVCAENQVVTGGRKIYGDQYYCVYALF